MDRIASRDGSDRRKYFNQAAALDGRLSPQLIEKDYWVCWTLSQLFQLQDLKESLLFKGGTSLSKVYGAIQRFSEDIDLSIDRAQLGFGGSNDPEAARGKQRKRLLEALTTACAEKVSHSLLPKLIERFRRVLRADDTWDLRIDPDTNDGKTILFHYPPAIQEGLARYFAPSVRIEIGARSDHEPLETGTVLPYVHEILGLSQGDSVSLRVLAPHRTFWEKATILHAECHRDPNTPLPKRLARHYYDLSQLSEGSIGRRALENLDLLVRVAEHKNAFFRSSRANYQSALPGTLRLSPPAKRIAELQRDYTDMLPMFFGSPPSFDWILEQIARLEEEVNSTAR